MREASPEHHVGKTADQPKSQRRSVEQWGRQGEASHQIAPNRGKVAAKCTHGAQICPKSASTADQCHDALLHLQQARTVPILLEPKANNNNDPCRNQRHAFMTTRCCALKGEPIQAICAMSPHSSNTRCQLNMGLAPYHATVEGLADKSSDFALLASHQRKLRRATTPQLVNRPAGAQAAPNHNTRRKRNDYTSMVDDRKRRTCRRLPPDSPMDVSAPGARPHEKPQNSHDSVRCPTTDSAPSMRRRPSRGRATRAAMHRPAPANRSRPRRRPRRASRSGGSQLHARTTAHEGGPARLMRCPEATSGPRLATTRQLRANAPGTRDASLPLVVVGAAEGGKPITSSGIFRA